MSKSLVRPSLTLGLTVAEVVARLSWQVEVDGVVMMGSGGSGAFSPTSDIDLLVVLNEGFIGTRMISTTLENRLAEVYFIQVGELDAWLMERPLLPQEDFTAVRLRWIEGGQVLFDRQGRLERLRKALRAGGWSRPADEAEAYAAWYATNYDLVQTRRLVLAEDPDSWMKADLRMLRMLAELWERYFTLRRLPAQSEKGRARWMRVNDRDFLAGFQACLAEPDRAGKFELYVKLAQRALEPAGGLWPENATAVEMENGSPAAAEVVLDKWDGWFENG